MSTPTTGLASQGGHWYSRDGAPAYKVPAKNGQLRPVTLRDARQLDLVPSVTTIIGMANAEGLNNWKVDQAILSALTLPRWVLNVGAPAGVPLEYEPEAEWLVRVKRDSQEQGRKAAERGTEIHAAIEAWYGARRGAPVPDMPDHCAYLCNVVAGTIDRHFGDYEWIPERSFAHSWGYGGKADLLAEYGGQGIVLDIKSKDVVDDKTKGYSEHQMQLAAYRFGLGFPDARCANIYVSRQEPWTVKVVEWTEDELEQGMVMFGALLRYWTAKNKFDPSWSELPEVEW